MRKIRLLVGTLLMAVGCDKQAPRVPDSSRAAPVVLSAAPRAVVAPAPPLPSVAAAAADPAAALTRYLAFESFRGAPAGSDSLAECPAPEGEGWEPDNYVGIVQPIVLGASLVREDTTGTTATGRAAVTRVVVFARGAEHWVGTPMQRRDTLTFPLRREPAGWTVCGPAWKSDPGWVEFVVTYDDAVRTEINGARWPGGMTVESVARHADSVISAGRP
jgi:hypothetical protein